MKWTTIYEYLRLNLMEMRKIWNYNLPVKEVHACELLPSSSLHNELQAKRIQTQMGTQAQLKTHIRIQTQIVQRMLPGTTNKPTLFSSGGRARDFAFLFPRFFRSHLYSSVIYTILEYSLAPFLSVFCSIPQFFQYTSSVPKYCSEFFTILHCSSAFVSSLQIACPASIWKRDSLTWSLTQFIHKWTNTSTLSINFSPQSFI